MLYIYIKEKKRKKKVSEVRDGMGWVGIGCKYENKIKDKKKDGFEKGGRGEDEEGGEGVEVRVAE